MATFRFSFSVTGVLKFLSHLDLLKLFTRSLLRAGLPVAYSEGFNPHPRISFGPPRGVGIEGMAEYCDLQLQRELPPEEIIEKLNKALPDAVRVQGGRMLNEGPTPALMAIINLTEYEVICEENADLLAELAANVQAFAEADKLEIVRTHPRKGEKVIDIKAGVSLLEMQGNRLKLEIPFNAEGAVKPMEVISAIMPKDLAYKMVRKQLWVIDENGERRLP